MLLACGILILVALLSIILWLGNRKRNEERRDSQESQRSSSSHTQGRDCLFKEVFAEHPDHDSPLIALCDEDGPSFIAAVRKRSQAIAGAVKQELQDLRRNLKLESLAAESRPLLERDLDAEPSKESGGDEDITQQHSNTRTNRGQDGTTRRRNSSSITHDRPKKRKSEEQPVDGCESG